MAAAVAYFASARLGYALAIPHGIVTLWPPSGVMLGLLALSKRRDWAPIVVGGFIGSVLSDLFSGFSPGFALASGLANVSESLLAAWYVTSRLGSPVSLTSLRSLLQLTLGPAIVTNSLTAILGAAALHYGFHLGLIHAWFVWWSGDGLGMLVVAPAVIAWASAPAYLRTLSRAARFEAASLLAALALAAVVALGPRYGLVVQPGPYFTIPLLFWAALRFGPLGATAGALIVSAFAVSFAAHGVGPFVEPGATQITIAAQVYAFLGMTSIAVLIPASILAERQVASRRLIESEERYRSVVDAAIDVIITIDEHSRIEFTNPAVERVFGYTASELVGHDLTTLMPTALRDRHSTGIAHYVATAEKRIEWHGVALTGLHKDGREIPIEVSFGESYVGGRHLFTGILRDMRERRLAAEALEASEERMRFAMEAARVGTWQFDFATGEGRWSATHEKLHGLAPGSFGGTDEAFQRQIHPQDLPAVVEALDAATRNHTDSNILYRTIWPDGTTHWISGVGRTFYDDDGIPVRAAGIGLDSTERRALEEQFRQSQKMEAVGQLAGGVAHDFNNILTAIHGYASLLTEGLASESLHQHDVLEVLRAAERGASLTRQLLAFSRQQVLAPRVLDLSESLKAIMPMVKRLIGEDIKVVVRPQSGLGHIKADPGQIEQVVLNLALNARDAMPEGGTLRLELQDVVVDGSNERLLGLAPGDYVRLSVIDTGVGMDAATVSRVFEPFFSTKPQGKGTGLGLATVYGVVKQSGGSVHVNSELGRGSTFQIYLPAVDAPVDARSSTMSDEVPSGSETILVVEDDEALRRMACRILELRGYQVLCAGNPREAVEIVALTSHRIDLLLSDVVLPEMNGRLLAEELTRRHPELRVLFMSGYTDDAVVHRGVRQGETHFLQKPFVQGDLLRKVRETLDGAPVRQP
jgi:PAS domain S-box-containing protein